MSNPFVSKSTKELIEELDGNFDRLYSENNRLREENKVLKDENYKDNELAKLNEENEKLARRINHYGMYDDDWDNLMAAWDKHVKEHVTSKDTGKMRKAPLASYKIEVEEFPECTCYSIVCNKCGKKKTIYY